MVYWLAQYKEQEEAPPNCGARVSMEYNKPIAALEVGDEVHITGRLHSRKYRKVIQGVESERTAYEISVMELEPEG